MKHFIASLTFIICLSGLAQAQTNGNAFFSITGNFAFQLSIDGIRVNPFPARNLGVENLKQGDHNAEVTVFRAGLQSIRFNSVFNITPGRETGYYIQETGGQFTFMMGGSQQIVNGIHANDPVFQFQFANTRMNQGVFVQVPNNFNPAGNSWTDASGWAPPNNAVPFPAENPPTALGAPCSPPGTPDQFNTAMNRIKSKSVESGKLAIAKDIVENGCFTTDQILGMMRLLAIENDRVDFGKTAWHHCSDPENWSFVYDGLDYGSNIESLKKYVRARPYTINAPTPPPYQQEVVIEQPVPQPRQTAVPGYNGNIGCEWPMDGNAFQAMKSSISSKSFSSTQMTILKQAVPAQGCITTAQVISLMEIFSFENDKVEAAKFCWNYVYDMDSYYQVSDAFGFSSSTDAMNKYLEQHPRQPVGRIGDLQPAGPAPIPQGNQELCPPMDGGSFNTLKASIQKQISPSSKFSVMKQALAKNCVSSAQTKDLMGMFSSDFDRLDVAKYCWLRVSDPQNFFQVNDKFSFSSKSRDLEAYMKANPR